MKILAAIDGSSFSNVVVQELASRKWTSDSIVKLVTITNKNEHSNSVQDTQQKLNDITQYLSQIHPNIQFQPEIHQADNVSQELLKLATAWQAELLVVAAHGKGALERALLGSVSQTLLEHGMVPVILAKERPLNAQQNSINILVSSDNSLFSEKAIEWFLKQSWTKPVHIKFITVLPLLPAEFSSEQNIEKAANILSKHQQMKDEFMAALKQWEAYIHQYIAPATLEFQILEGVPQDEIVALAKQWPANLIVMGSHGHLGLKRYLIGSVAKAVSHNSNCSVEIVRLPDFEEYYRHWENIAKRKHFENLKKSGQYEIPHAMPIQF